MQVDSTQSASQNRFEWVIAPIALALATLVILRPVDSFDVWWHLTSGLQVLRQGPFQFIDDWSFTLSGREFANVSWLFQTTLALAYQLFGDWGLYLTKWSLALAALLFAYRANPNGRNLAAFLFVLAVLYPNLYGHLHLRSLLAELTLLGAGVFLVRKEWNRTSATLAVLLVVLWANVHASVVVGAVGMGLHALFGRWQSGTPVPQRLILAGLIGLAPLVSPLGLGIIPVLLDHGGDSFAMHYITEWFPPSPYSLGLWLSVLLVVLAALRKRVALAVFEWFVLAFFFLFSLKSNRFELELAFVLLRPLSQLLDQALRALVTRRFAGLLALALLAAHLLVFRALHLNNFQQNLVRLPVDSQRYPAHTSSQLAHLAGSLGRPVRVLNDYDYGAYISFATEGQAKIYVDGRVLTHFPESLMIPPYESSAAVVERLWRMYDFDAVLLKLASSKIGLEGSPEWRMVGYDAASVLFVREQIARDAGLPEIGYDPARYGTDYPRDPIADYQQQTEQLLRATGENPLALIQSALLGLARIDAGLGGDLSEVLTRLERSLAVDPLNEFARSTYAYLIATRLDPRRHREALIEALPDPARLQTSLAGQYFLVYGETLLALGEPALARSYLVPDSQIISRSLARHFKTWLLRARLYHELGEPAKAVNALEIAREMHDPAKRSEIQSLAQITRLLETNEGQ